MAVMTSDAGTCSIGGTAIADADILERCLRDGLDEVPDLARPAQRQASSPPSRKVGDE